MLVSQKVYYFSIIFTTLNKTLKLQNVVSVQDTMVNVIFGVVLFFC